MSTNVPALSHRSAVLSASHLTAGLRAGLGIVLTPFSLPDVGDCTHLIPTPVRRPSSKRCHVPSIVKINVLTVPEEQREVLEQRFGARAGSVENSDGFEWFELLRPLEGTDQYLVYTRWRDEEAFQAWMEGPMKAAHQQGRPAEGKSEGEAGEKPKPAATGSTLWSFEVVQQAAPKNS